MSHLLAAGVGFEPRPGTNPVRALLRNRALRHLVAQAHLELGAVEARLTRDARDVELALLLCRLFPNECGRGFVALCFFHAIIERDAATFTLRLCHYYNIGKIRTPLSQFYSFKEALINSAPPS